MQKNMAMTKRKGGLSHRQYRWKNPQTMRYLNRRLKVGVLINDLAKELGIGFSAMRSRIRELRQQYPGRFPSGRTVRAKLRERITAHLNRRWKDGVSTGNRERQPGTWQKNMALATKP